MRYCLIVLAWLGLVSSVSADIVVEDAIGRTVKLERPATRVVSLAPHITEVVYAAGAGDLLVGAVSYSDYPEAAKSLPQVGSYDSISYEALVSLKPDLVLAWHEGNGEEVVSRLESLGVTVYVGEPSKLEDVAELLRVVGELTGNQEIADEAADDFLDKLSYLKLTYSGQQSVSVYYQIWDEPLLTLNGDHLISDVVRLCGGRNVFADAIPLVSRISVESVVRSNPQVIVASGMDKARPEWLEDWRVWESMQAVSNDQLYFVPPDILQRHTPRIIEGATMLCNNLQKARDHYSKQQDRQQK